MSSKLSLVRPFGPYIGKFKFPEPFIKDVNSFIDNSENDPEVLKSLDWSQNLVGKVHQELRVPNYVLLKHEEFLQSQASQYLKSITDMGVVNLDTRVLSVKRGPAWVVRSNPGDFNPAHVHSDATICMAGFLKTPDWDDELLEDSDDHAPSRGKLCFMHGNTEEWGNNLMLIEPKVGDCYIFPATLTHFVYPFKSSGERRSFSVNFQRL